MSGVFLLAVIMSVPRARGETPLQMDRRVRGLANRSQQRLDGRSDQGVESATAHRPTLIGSFALL